MKIKICLLGIFAVATLATAAPHAWVLKTGETVTGDYVSSSTITIVVKTDGTNCSLKISDLSSNDLAFVKNIQKTNNEAALLEARKEFVKKYEPLRVINGELYDFSVLFSLRSQVDQDAQKGVSSFSFKLSESAIFCVLDSRTVSGKVIQVLDDGLLVHEQRDVGFFKKDGSFDFLPLDRFIFLKNYRGQSKVVDGSSIRAFALPSGRHQYENTMGAGQTILAFDCGRIYNPDSDTFSNKTIFTYTKSGEYYVADKKILPVTDFDRQLPK